MGVAGNRSLTGQAVGATLVPKPGSSTVTQEHLPGRKSDALLALGLSQVT